MAAQHLPYVTLDSCVLDYLNESEQGNNKYFKVWHLAARGCEQMGLDFFYRIQSVKLPVNANFTVTLPANYLNWIKVGILNNNGSIIPLCYNNSLTTFADLLPNRVELTDDPQSSWMEWWGSWGNTWSNVWNGYSYTNVYGVPSGEPFAGQFKVDTENGVILLGQHFNRDYIMLEYLCSPVEGSDVYLPIQFREAMIAWLAWKDNKAKSIRSHMQLGNNRDLRHEFFVERRNAFARWKPIRSQERYQISQETSRLAIKT